MAKINLSEVEALCTAAETSLIKQTLTPALERLSAAELKARIGRARKLRDKFVDKSRHQRREVRGKAAPRGARPASGDARTVRKAELFEDALARLQDRLGRLDDGAPAPRAAKKKKPGKVERAAAKRARKAATADDAPTGKKKAKKKAKKVSAAKALLVASKKKKAARSAVSRKGAERPDDLTAPRGAKRAAASSGSKAKREEQRLADTSQKKILAHVSSAGRRSQAKRDSR